MGRASTLRAARDEVSLGRRVGAAIIDFLPAGALMGSALLTGFLSWLTIIVAVVLSLVYSFFLWWSLARHGAGLGGGLMGVTIVDSGSHQPIGCTRIFLRWAVMIGMAATVVGGCFLMKRLRRSPSAGWHDKLVGAQVVAPKLAVDMHHSSDRRAVSVDADARTQASTEWIRLGTPLSAVGDGRSQWSIALDDGRVVPLDVTVLLGRNPQRRPDDPITQLVPSSGDGRTVDRTHVMIGTDSRGVFVVDRDSSTGTAVQLPDGSLEELRPERKAYVADGQRVVYGERWFIVQREESR